jgi:ribonuclease HII
VQLEATVTRYSLDELRQRYVIQGRPLEAASKKSCALIPARERALSLLRLKSAASRTGLKGSGFARCCALRRFCGRGAGCRSGRRRGRNEPARGPVLAAAVILKPGTRINGIDDSKKLDANSREALAKEIKEKAASWSVAFVEVEEIDTINIYWASRNAAGC